MTKVNIREALNQMDKDTNCKYDLVTLYEGYNFNDEEKKEIAKMISDNEDAEVIYDRLSDKFGKDVDFDDDDISDIKESFGDDLIDSQYQDDISDGHWSWDYDDDELANIYGGDTKYDNHPDGVDIDESLNEVTQLKLFDDDMVNDIEILHQWRPEEVEKILVKHGASPNNDTWITGLDLPAAYSEIMSTFKDKYSDYDEIDYSVAKVLGLVDESLKEESSNKGWVKRWNFLDNYYKGDLVISKISSPVDAWHVEKVAPNGHTIKHLGSYKSLEVAMDAAEKHLIKNESKSIKEDSKSGYWYFTRHGVQPGSIPKGANVLMLRDVENGTYVKLDRVLTTKELNDYEIIEKRPAGLDDSKSIKESSLVDKKVNTLGKRGKPMYFTAAQLKDAKSRYPEYDFEETTIEYSLPQGQKAYIAKKKTNESKSIKESNKIAYGNEKYKGYMIRQDHKYGGYNVYDKEDEIEDSGFTTIDKAKEFIDSLEESKSIKEDYSDEVVTLSRYLDVEVPDICRGVLDLIEHLPSHKISYATKICRDFYTNMENIIENYIMTGDNLKESSYGGAYDILDDAYFTKEDGMIAANEVAYQLEKEFPEAKLEVMDMQLDNHSFYVVLTDKDGNEFTEEITLDMRKIRHPLDLIKKYAPALTERFIKQIKDYYSEM